MDSEIRKKTFVLDCIAESNKKKLTKQDKYNPVYDRHLQLFFMKPSIKKIIAKVDYIIKQQQSLEIQNQIMGNRSKSLSNKSRFEYLNASDISQTELIKLPRIEHSDGQQQDLYSQNSSHLHNSDEGEVINQQSYIYDQQKRIENAKIPMIQKQPNMKINYVKINKRNFKSTPFYRASSEQKKMPPLVSKEQFREFLQNMQKQLIV